MCIIREVWHLRNVYSHVTIFSLWSFPPSHFFTCVCGESLGTMQYSGQWNLCTTDTGHFVHCRRSSPLFGDKKCTTTIGKFVIVASKSVLYCRVHYREALNEGSILMMYVRAYIRVQHDQECR